MDEKQPNSTGQPVQQEKPLNESPGQKGSNDPDFVNQDAQKNIRSGSKNSRELPPDPNFIREETNLHSKEQEIDPGNEHRHSENDEFGYGNTDLNEDKEFHPPY